MEKVYDKCCGIDVHKKLLVACFKSGTKQEIRNFGATTREILDLCNWLKDGECEMVAILSFINNSEISNKFNNIISIYAIFKTFYFQNTQ